MTESIVALGMMALGSWMAGLGMAFIQGWFSSDAPEVKFKEKILPVVFMFLGFCWTLACYEQIQLAY